MKDFLPLLPANRWLFFFCCFVFLNLINCCYYFILACLFAAVSCQLHQAEISAESWDFLSSWDCFLVVLQQRSTLKSGPPANQSDTLLIRTLRHAFPFWLSAWLSFLLPAKLASSWSSTRNWSIPFRYGTVVVREDLGRGHGFEWLVF